MADANSVISSLTQQIAQLTLNLTIAQTEVAELRAQLEQAQAPEGAQLVGETAAEAVEA